MAFVKQALSGFKYRADSLMIHTMEEGLSAPFELGQDDEKTGAEQMVGNSAQEVVKGKEKDTLMMDDEAGLRRVPELGDQPFPFDLPSTPKRDVEQRTDEDSWVKVRIVERESPLTIQVSYSDFGWFRLTRCTAKIREGTKEPPDAGRNAKELQRMAANY